VNYIAVVEDSAQDRAVLDSYLEKYQQEKNCHFQITHFSDGDEIALGYKGGYDLILMDIEMTFLDGMSAAEEIRRADPEVLIIFITNSPQYAIKGYAVQALDYILKPLSYYAFCQRMNHVRELLGRRQKHFLTVPCAGGVQKLDVSDIYYVEICDHDLLFHTKQGEVHSTGSMRDVEQKLPPENFFRSSKAYLVNLEQSDGYNPFRYIRDEKDALRLVNTLIQATTPKNSHESDPFWTKAETALLQAIILMLFQEAPESEQNFSMVMRVLEYAEVKEDDEDHVSPLDLLFSAIEREKPDSVAVRQYKVFKMAAGKTSKSILVSTAVRLAPFNLPQIRAITDHDDMDLYTLGEKKCALYAVIPDNDNTYNFLVSLLYSQVFQTLYYCADQIHHGPLPRHVHFILDEAPSVNLPGLPRELATMRSRNISCSTIIQNMAQIKEQFKDSWETIPGNSDTLLYLGGNESSTHKYISEALGKSTIDTKTHGETKGKSGSWSTNMQISGRELLTPDEVRRLDNRYAILLIRGAGPVMDLKYDLMKHPAVRQTSLAGGPPYIHHRQNQAPVISGHEFFAAFSTDDANENKENAA